MSLSGVTEQFLLKFIGGVYFCLILQFPIVLHIMIQVSQFLYLLNIFSLEVDVDFDLLHCSTHTLPLLYSF